MGIRPLQPLLLRSEISLFWRTSCARVFLFCKMKTKLGHKAQWRNTTERIENLTDGFRKGWGALRVPKLLLLFVNFGASNRAPCPNFCSNWLPPSPLPHTGIYVFSPWFSNMLLCKSVGVEIPIQYVNQKTQQNKNTRWAKIKQKWKKEQHRRYNGFIQPYLNIKTHGYGMNYYPF